MGRRRKSCPCRGYFSDADQKRLESGVTCQFLIDERHKSIAWHEEFARKVGERLGLGGKPEEYWSA